MPGHGGWAGSVSAAKAATRRSTGQGGTLAVLCSLAGRTAAWGPGTSGQGSASKTDLQGASLFDLCAGILSCRRLGSRHHSTKVREGRTLEAGWSGPENGEAAYTQLSSQQGRWLESGLGTGRCRQSGDG